MSVQAFFFESGAVHLHGVLHRSAVPSRGLGAVFVAPLLEERQDAHAVYRYLAEQFSAAGYPVLRFDLFGNGESEGKWCDGTLEQWEQDVASAARTLREASGVDRIALFGLRSGGAVAALASRSVRPERLGLWQPIVRGKRFLSDLLRAHVAGEMALARRSGITRETLLGQLERGESVDLSGYILTPRHYAELSALDLQRDLTAYGGPTLLADIARRVEAPEPAELASLRQCLPGQIQLRRVVETQPLHVDGKVVYTRAANLAAVSLEWMMGSAQ